MHIDTFPAERIVFRWKPTPLDQVTPYDDIADEYAVISSPHAASGIVLYALYRGEWTANPFSDRALVAHLLKLLGSSHGLKPLGREAEAQIPVQDALPQAQRAPDP